MKRTLLTLMLAALSMPALRAQDQEDGPGRGVARLSLMNGDVSVRRGDSGDWVAAVINAPLMVEDRVLTGAGSRTEVQFDYFHRLRLAEDSEVRFSELEYRQYQIQVARGTVTLSALKGGDAQVEISTPGAAVRPLAHGQYRVTVRQDGAVEITVREGEAEIFTPSGSEKLRPGRTMLVRVSGEGSQFQTVAAIPRDRWDDFNNQRDRELNRSNAYRYVSRDIYGAEDLDGHGEWIYAAPYGYVWSPRVAIDWAPYRYGRWSWLDWYGWSWVSYDPWGWAPYHYGRWFHHGGRWCWWPGAGMRHYWSPGLVAWFGFGSGGFGFGVNAGFGFGNWGWVPLAPYEPYYRWYGNRWYGGYRNHTTIVNNIRVVNNTNIYNNYRNARVSHGVSVLEGGDFTRGAGGRAWRNSDGEFTRASLMQGPLPATPGRANLNYTDRAVRSDLAARGSTANERFYSRRETARVDRVPFDQQRQSLERVARSPEARTAEGRAPEGRIGGTEGRRGLETGGDGPRGSNPLRGETPAETRGGWRRADEPARANSPAEGGRTYGSGDSWRRFGEPRTNERADDSGRLGRGTDSSPARSESPAARQAESQDRGGWRSFGDPNRGSRSSENVVRESPRSEGSRGTWSTGGGGRGETMRQESPRSESPRNESPRSEGSRGTWSTGGGGRSESPRMERSEPARSEPSRSEPSRSEPSRMERSAPPSRGAEPQRQESAPSRRGGSDMSGFSRGGWSTGGGSSSQSFGGSDSSTYSGSSGRGSWSTGGGSSSRPYGGSDSSTYSGSSGRGSWSSGMGRSSDSSYGSPGSGGFSRGDSGMRSQPQMSSPRGSFGGGYSAPSYGGGRSSGGMSGGGFGGGRSSGGMSSGGMSSGGGGRMSGGGGGGGGRMSGGGGRGR